MKKYVFSSFILLAPLVFGFILSMDIFVPDIPSIVTALHTTPDIAQITLSAFMLTLGIGQLILGPFSDQIGRYKVAIFSSLLYLLSSIACSYADTIYILILARIIQAIGACGMLVVAFAATRDQFNDKQAGQMYSLLNCCIGLSPLVAPIIGSYLNVYYGWRSAFWFLSIVALIIFIITLCFFKETLPKTKRLPITKQLITRYIQVLKNFCFIANVFLVVAGMSMFFTFFSFSPYILINILHKPESDFGFYFFLVGFTFFIGSYVSAYIIKRSSLLKVAMTGIIINLLAGLWMLSSYIYFGTTIIGFIGPCMLLGIGGAMIMGAGAGAAMLPFAEYAGTAAALMGFLQFSISSFIGLIALTWLTEGILPVAICILGLSLTALCLQLAYRKRL